ncbi:hypothetical protein [Sphingomonas quercus]|uniref:Uncharacterized protein n=1 Tax=Sphingomonas quercus TaxID=2842451 RepID=A0ABS6BF91_9SPHN|nr:hypothetical protein [Sphingomonas quercus]MBU3076496.1 hypothetical protein [Sphingomonas quercus]
MTVKTDGKSAADGKAPVDKGEKGERNAANGNVARWIGIGAGIGSAAVAAAVLYANRDWLKAKAAKAEKHSRLAEQAED